MASDDEDDLEALRLIALASMKNKKKIDAAPSSSKNISTPTSKSNSSVAAAAPQILPVSSYSSPTQSVYGQPPPTQYTGSYSTGTAEHYKNNFSNGGSFNSRRQPAFNNRGGNQQRPVTTSSNTSRPSGNLIVINTVPLEEDKKDTVKLDSYTRVNETRPILIRPQDRWALTDDDSQSSNPSKPKSNDKFSRYQSDSESDSDMSSDDEDISHHSRKIHDRSDHSSEDENKHSNAKRNEESDSSRSSRSSSVSSSSTSSSSSSDNESDDDKGELQSKADHEIISVVKSEFVKHVSKLNSELEKKIETLSKTDELKSKPSDIAKTPSSNAKTSSESAKINNQSKPTNISDSVENIPMPPSRATSTNTTKSKDSKDSKQIVSSSLSSLETKKTEPSDVHRKFVRRSRSKTPVRKFCFKSGSPIRRKSRSRSKSAEKTRGSNVKGKLIRSSRSISPARKRKLRSSLSPITTKRSMSPISQPRKKQSPIAKRKSRSKSPVVKKSGSSSPVITKWAFRSGSPIRRKRSNSKEGKQSRSPIRKKSPTSRRHSRSKSPMVPKNYRLQSEKNRSSSSLLTKAKSKSLSPLSKNYKPTNINPSIGALKDKKVVKSVQNSKTKGKNIDENINEKLEARKKKFESATEVESEKTTKKISLKGIVPKSKKKKSKDTVSKKEVVSEVPKPVNKDSNNQSVSETKSSQKSTVTEKKQTTEKTTTSKETLKKRRSSGDIKKKMSPKKLHKTSDSESSSDSMLSDSDSDSDSQTWRNKKSRKSERMTEDIERERRQRLQQERKVSQNKTSRDKEMNSFGRNSFDNRRNNMRREDRFKEHKNKIFVAMSDDDEDDNRFKRNNSRKSYFDSKDNADGKSLKIEVNSNSEQLDSGKKRKRQVSADDGSVLVSKLKENDSNKTRSEREDSPLVVVTLNTKENENNSAKKSRLSVHERLGKQLTDDRKIDHRKIVTKSKSSDSDDEDSRPNKKTKLQDKPRIRSSVSDVPRTEKRRSLDELDPSSSTSGQCDDLEDRIRKIKQKNEAIVKRQAEVMMDKQKYG